MKTLLTLAFIACTLFSCTPEVEDNFPNKVVTTMTDAHQRFEGTNVFGKIPVDYTFLKQFERYKKTNNVYILVEEHAGGDFDDFKASFNKEILEAEGVRVDLFKEIQFNEYAAIYGEGSATSPLNRKVVFAFGNNYFTVLAIGQYPENNTTGRDELLEMFQSFVYEE